jgi:BolA protein
MPACFFQAIFHKSGMGIAARIREKIAQGFPNATVVLEDQSARHAGHAGAAPGGETHFHLTITDPVFEGMPSLNRQRKVNALLAEEFKDGLHALSLKLLTPREAQNR